PPLVYAASSRLGRAQIPYRLRERSEPDLRRRVIALRSATGFRPTKVLVANQHSGRDTRSTALGAKRVCRQPRHPTPRTSWTWLAPPAPTCVPASCPCPWPPASPDTPQYLPPPECSSAAPSAASPTRTTAAHPPPATAPRRTALRRPAAAAE